MNSNRGGATPPIPTGNSGFGNLRILAVEDHSFQRWELCMLLNDLGVRHVFNASDGWAALEVMQSLEDPIDIIITDLDMPGMDGLEFIRHVSELGRTASVILVSAHNASLIASVGTMAKTYGIPVLGTLEKPLTAPKLAEVLNHFRRNENTFVRKQHHRLKMPLHEISGGLRDGEFVAYFQPKVSLSTKKIMGAESVSRWRHADMGLLSPSEFVGSMEGTPLIDELTWIMLMQSAKACGKWRDAGLDISVSVNLSATSLSNTGFAEQVIDIVEQQHLDSRHMILEITESAAMSDEGHALENLSRLRMKGFGLSIDDFGTGYSSMHQLTRIAFTELKIDQSFVRNIAATGTQLAVLVSSLDIARRLKLCSVAEGIETEEEWKTLRELGCEQGQGYFIAMPMLAEALPGWARKWQKDYNRAFDGNLVAAE